VRIELTVTRGDRHADVAVEAPEHAPLGAVLPDLARAVDAGHESRLWRGADLLRPDTTLRATGLCAGAVLTFGARPRTQRRPTVLALHVVGGPAAGTVIPLERGRLTVGRGADCDLVLPDPDVSRRHAVLDVSPTGITLTDLGSTNGTTVDGQLVAEPGQLLQVGCLVGVGDSLLTVAGPVDAPAAVQPGDDGTVQLLRPPRRPHPLPNREVVVPTRAGAVRPRNLPWITALLPATAAAGVAWFAHAPQFLLFGLLSPAMAATNALGNRVHWRRSRRRDAAAFRRRRARADAQIAAGLSAESAARRAVAPDPAAVLRQATLPGGRLWERRRQDADLLRLRLGTADMPSVLSVRDGTAVAPAGMLRSVPMCVDLRRGPLGIAGPPDVTAGLARWLVGQLGALHSPADVELALLLDPDRGFDWAWTRWLPHLRTRVASSGDEWPILAGEIGAVIEERLERRQMDSAGWPGPWLVVVVDLAGKLAHVPGLAEMLTRGCHAGVAAVYVDASSTSLPAGCVAVARVHGTTGTRLQLREADGTETLTVIDQVSPAWADEVARAIAPLVDAGAEATAAVPDECRLLETLDLDEPTPAAVERRWATAGGGARAVLGRCADGVLEIDLAVDGPHALVAGTTGAGKSELLQSAVVSLAANHPPDELNVLLIDYKGGAAFADCARLPHTAGLLTDLDGYLTERALRALTSELRRRERLFAQTGASDLAGYRAGPVPQPVPRLVIVVDEFAALVEELPDFVRGLVGVAQRGRSLGVHLVLATQRPGSAVSAEIRANVTLRVSLRVTDPAESTDVLDVPVAATIDRGSPGRAYLRTGPVLTCFQAPHASASSRADPNRVEVTVLGPWRRRRPIETGAAPSELARLVTALQLAADTSGRRAAHRLWLEPLPNALPRADLDVPESGCSVALGWVDLPDEQRRASLVVDLAAGAALLVAGAARSGRTTVLLSLAVGAAAQLPPDRLHLHVLDATGALAAAVRGLPHCGTVLGPEELALAPRLLSALEHEAARRFAGPTPGAGPPARLLLLVDGWDAVCAALTDVDATLATDSMTGLLRVGAAAGISVAVTGDRAVLAPRFAANFGERLLLRLSDRTDYGLAGIAARDLPATLPPGRAIRAADRALVQFAHIGERADVESVRAAVAGAAWPGQPSDAAAIRIRSLPARVALRDLPVAAGRLALGVAGDRVDPVALDPFAGAGRLLVAGPPRSGRTTVLRLLARQAHAAGISMLVAATTRSPLLDDARRLGVPMLTPSAADVGALPEVRTLLLVDDSEAFRDCPAGERLTSWARDIEAPLAVVVAGRADDLATSYRGVAAEVRRSQCGILLRPGPVDGELFGVRLPRRPASGPPGRGVALGDPTWGPLFETGQPVPIQVAAP
jgi:S-DNA-T family DNA segregation ATPase FtsK/SpoIIIE